MFMRGWKKNVYNEKCLRVLFNDKSVFDNAGY